MLRKTDILGVKITDASAEEILEYVFSFLKEDVKKGYIVTPNPEIVTYAQAYPEYRKVLNEAEVGLCDGVGLRVAAILLGKHLRGRITGVDFMESLCKESVRKAVSVGFLGGKHSVALKTAECLSQKYPGLSVSFIGEEWTFDSDNARGSASSVRDGVSSQPIPMSSLINAVGTRAGSRFATPPPIDILFVAYGFPKQEEWIAANLSKIPVRMAMGVGGAFDYLAGGVVRAPFFIRALGVEWLFRLIVQPWRIRRQTALIKFAFLVLKERLLRSRYGQASNS